MPITISKKKYIIVFIALLILRSNVIFAKRFNFSLIQEDNSFSKNKVSEILKNAFTKMINQKQKSDSSRSSHYEDFINKLNAYRNNNFLNNRRIKNSNTEQTDRAPDHNPAIVSDRKGGFYLVWEHGNELWWAINRQGTWSNYGKIPKVEGSNPSIAYAPGLFDNGSSEGLFCTWESFESPKTLKSSLGRIRNEEIIWSLPQQLTNDKNDDFGTVLTFEENHNPLILWLQTGSILEDDTDLYYRIVTLNDQSFEFEQETETVNNEVSPQQLWPIAPLPPFNEYAQCVEHVFAHGESRLPNFIPFIGGKFGYQLFGLACAGVATTTSTAIEYPSDQLFIPFFEGSMNLKLSFGDHVNVVFSLFNLAETAFICKDNKTYPIDGSFFTGGDFFINYLTLPIPICVFAPLGFTRVGVIFQTGVDVFFTKFFDPNTFSGNYPDNLNCRVDEIGLLFDAGFGAQSQINSLGGGLSGDLFILGGFLAEQIIFPQCSELIVQPFITCIGATRCGGTWNGIVQVFEKTIVFGPIDPDDPIPPFFDTDLPIDPNKIISSGDNFIKRNLTEENNIKIYDALEYLKKPFQGTGSLYEGSPVLGDISSDLYNDGLPNIAKNNNSEIIAVWPKGFSPDCLGTKIYTAGYKSGSWSNPVSVTENIDFHETPFVIFDAQGNPMIAWSSASNEGLDYEKNTVMEILDRMEQADLLYTRRLEGKWTEPSVLAKLPGKDESVKLSLGAKGEITAVWINRSGSGSAVYSSFWNGKGWSQAVLITQTLLIESLELEYIADNPAIFWTQDDDNDLNSIEDWTIYFSLYKDGTWSKATALSFSAEDGPVNIVESAQKKDYRGKYLFKNFNSSFRLP